jgi:hypothetical protein
MQPQTYLVIFSGPPPAQLVEKMVHPRDPDVIIRPAHAPWPNSCWVRSYNRKEHVQALVADWATAIDLQVVGFFKELGRGALGRAQ